MISDKIVGKKAVESHPVYRKLKRMYDELLKKASGDSSLYSDNRLHLMKERIKLMGLKYENALDRIREQEKVLESFKTFSRLDPKPVKISYSKHVRNNTEAIAVSILSDMHAEERVDAKSVNFLNEYNLDVCKERMQTYFKGLVRLTEIERGGVIINELVINVLGDLIHGYIHEEYKKSNFLSPAQAILFVEEILISGIDYLKKYGKFKKITLICQSGNHSRTTDKTEISTSYANSFEWLLYKILAGRYRKDRIVQFVIPESIMYYYSIFDKVIRVIHGHELKYQGGVGGLDVPLKKAIAQWDKAKKADYTLLGHWHTLKADDNFVVNGSVVGYNAYAVQIKADYRPPQQAYFLIDNRRGLSVIRNMFLNK